MSEYNEKVCPICKNLNYIDAVHCYWCKYKFQDINKEITKTHCKYCNTTIEVNEYYNKSKGVVCKKCRKAKIGYNLLFYFLGIVIYLILSAILFSFGFKLGYLFSLLLLLAPHKIAEQFMLKKSSNNSAQKPIYIKSNNTQSTVNSEDINKNLELIENSQKKLIGDTMQQTDKKSKKRYCKLCGCIIDINTKKCTNCGKQYFKFNIFRNYALTAIISIIVTASVFGLICINLSNSSKPQLSYFESSVGIGGKNLSYVGKPNTDYYVEVYLVYNMEQTLLDAFTTTSTSEGYIPINIRVDKKGLYEIMIYNQSKDDYLCTYFEVK